MTAGYASVSFKDTILRYLCIITAITLQIQVTLFHSADYLGLRINLTDILVPFAGLAILISLAQKTSVWPAWPIKNFYPWLLALTFLMTFALLETYFLYGKISAWAALNKYLGWFVLMAITGMGGWIATNANRAQTELFLKTFLYLALAIMAYQLLIITLQSYKSLQPYTGYYKYTNLPMAGAMVNRNAYGLFITGITLMTLCYYFSKTAFLKPAFAYALFFLLPMFFAFNYSRATFLTLCFFIPVILAINIKQKEKCFKIFMSLVLGCLLLFGLFHDKKQEILVLQLKPYEMIARNNGDAPLEYPGDNMRVTILKDSLEMVRARPLTGSGLGSSFFYQEEKHGRAINVIDCTPMWILVEMGAIGLGLFVLFYLQVLKALWQPIKDSDDFLTPLRYGLFLVVLSFAVISLVHEIMYTRHIWFLIGFGLCLPVKTRQDG